MKKQSIEEEFWCLIEKIAEIAKEKDIPFIAGTPCNLVTVGDASDLLTISLLAVVNVAVSTGIPVEKLIERSTILLKPMYEEVRRLHKEEK